MQGVRAAVLIGSYSNSGVANLGMFFSLQHLGADPPMMSLLFRPESAQGQTLGYLRTQKWISANYVLSTEIDRAHRCSAAFEAERSEFEATGLSVHLESGIPAPFVAEAPIRIALELESEMLLPNQCVLAILHLRKLWIESEALDAPSDLPRFDSLLHVNGLDAYYRVEFDQIKPYERP
jgi:flavin reductase (DIM6/NTAB) family NADH-FMN oxidoreductase RutF